MYLDFCAGSRFGPVEDYGEIPNWLKKVGWMALGPIGTYKLGVEQIKETTPFKPKPAPAPEPVKAGIPIYLPIAIAVVGFLLLKGKR